MPDSTFEAADAAFFICKQESRRKIWIFMEMLVREDELSEKKQSTNF